MILSYDMEKLWRDLPLCVIDVETTGFDFENDRVTEVGIVRFEKGRKIEAWGSLVNPGIPIPAQVTEITGITDEMVSEAPPFRDIFWDVASRIRDRILVAYNLPFDRSMLQAEFHRCGMGWSEVPGLDPLVWARALMPNARSRSLGAVAEILQIPMVRAHRAVDDAEATGKVVYKLADKVPPTLGELLAQQSAWEGERQAKRARSKAKRAKKPAPAPAAKANDGQGGLF